MITLDLRDPRLLENAKAVILLRQTGMFTDDEIKEMFEKQIQTDEMRDKIEEDAFKTQLRWLKERGKEE